MAPRPNNAGRLLVLLANAAFTLTPLALIGACGARIDPEAARAGHVEVAMAQRAAAAEGRVKASHDAAAAKAAAAPKAKTAARPEPRVYRSPGSAGPLPRPARPTARAERGEWVGVAASRGVPGAVAAWSSESVAWSKDGGRTYARVLEGRGHVDAAAVDAQGALFVVRDAKQLAVRTPDGAVHRRSIPFAVKTRALVANAGVLAWVGAVDDAGADDPAIAVSKDDGATWAFAKPPELGDYANTLAIDDDGTLRLVVDQTAADCGGGYQARYTANVSDLGAWTASPWPVDASAGVTLGARGFAYGVADCGEGDGNDHLCAIDAEGHAEKVAPVQAQTFHTLRATTSGGVTWGTLDGKLAWLDGTTVMFPARSTPNDFVVTAIDGDGQPIGVSHGKAMRWSRDGQWHTLFTPPQA